MTEKKKKEFSVEEVCVGVSDATANIVVNEERKRESPFRYHQALEFESSEPKRKVCVCRVFAKKEEKVGRKCEEEGCPELRGKE